MFLTFSAHYYLYFFLFVPSIPVNDKDIVLFFVLLINIEFSIEKKNKQKSIKKNTTLYQL